MISGKQRSYLRGLAHDLDPLVHIGKAGLSANVINELDVALENRELVKVKLQEGCEGTPKDLANEVCGQLGAEFVQSIGRKFSIYRPSKENRTIILPGKEKK
jgi:RNA-binding protein